MSTKPDIESRKDIKKLIDVLYEKFIVDELLGHMFKGEFEDNMANHLSIITDFWEDALFKTKNYKEDLLDKHLELNHIYRLKQQHFTKWLQLFNETVDQFFEGKNANISKDRARTITIVLKLKIDHLEALRLGFNN